MSSMVELSPSKTRKAVSASRRQTEHDVVLGGIRRGLALSGSPCNWFVNFFLVV